MGGHPVFWSLECFVITVIVLEAVASTFNGYQDL